MMGDPVFVFFAAAAALLVFLTNISLWSRRRLRVKLTALLIALLFLPAGYLALITLLGRPKPIDLEWTAHEPDDTVILASQMVEGEAIYLWAALPEIPEPRAFVLPWDEELAKQLHEAQRTAEDSGGTVHAKLPRGDQHQAGERMFYEAPPPPPAPKGS